MGAVDADEEGSRARRAWSALEVSCVRPARDGALVHEPGHRRAVHLWPWSQVLHAAALLAAGGIDATAPGRLDVASTLARHRRRGGTLAAAPGGREAFYDDAAWVALAGLELARTDGRGLALAQSLWPFLRSGAVDCGHDGLGVRWKVGGTALHACSTAPTGLVAARLALCSDDPAQREELQGFALGCRRFVVQRLVRDDGLVADHVRADGHVDTTVWAYNQGSLIALDVALAALERDVGAARARVEEASALAVRALDHLAEDDRMWRQPPVFVAILLRELLALDAASPDPRWGRETAAYADRVWREGRDPRTGLVGGAGGIGRYDSGVVLDHAGVTQLWTLLAATGAWTETAADRTVGAEGLEPPATSL